jgi:hypothetical protein
VDAEVACRAIGLATSEDGEAILGKYLRYVSGAAMEVKLIFPTGANLAMEYEMELKGGVERRLYVCTGTIVLNLTAQIHQPGLWSFADAIPRFADRP